jgi:hypothetical protein
MVNGVVTPVSILVAPLDHYILGGSNNVECTSMREAAFLGASIRIETAEWTLERGGETLLGPQKSSGAQIIDDVFQCNHADVPPNTLVIGLLGTEYGWHLDNRTLHIHSPRSTIMLNTWWDTVIINVCLLSYMHYLSDRRKNPRRMITLIPELVGSAFALLGLYRQTEDGGAYNRVSDYEYGQSAPIMLTWAVLAASGAHLAALVLEYEDFAMSDRKTLLKIRAARNLSYEYALLASIFMQVVTGYAEVYQNYM